MFRAAIFGARLGFDLDPLVIEAIAELRHLITKASPARMLEEYFKVLRSGFARSSFRALGRTRLLEHDHAGAQVSAGRFLGFARRNRSLPPADSRRRRRV